MSRLREKPNKRPLFCDRIMGNFETFEERIEAQRQEYLSISQYVLDNAASRTAMFKLLPRLSKATDAEKKLINDIKKAYEHESPEYQKLKVQWVGLAETANVCYTTLKAQLGAAGVALR